jgi:IgGFc binding protein
MGQTRQLWEASDVSSGAGPRARVVDRVRRLPTTRAAGAAFTLALAASASVASGGCGNGDGGSTGASDGARDGSDSQIDLVTDAGIDASVIVPSCLLARAVCDGSDLRACVAGMPGNVIDTCPDACSLGRCTTLACAEVERAEGARGCRFYGAQVDNVDSDDRRNLMVILSNARSIATRARVEVRDPDLAWETLIEVVIPANGGSRIEINRPLLESGLARAGAYRIESDGPVLAVQLISDDSDHSARSSGGTALRPLQALGDSYLAITYPGLGSQEVLRTTGSRGGAATISVIGTSASTVVQLGLTAGAVSISGVVLDPPPPNYQVTLDEGDVFQVFSSAPDGDLTGTTIQADAPVAVFSGNIFTTYGYAVTGFNGGDLAEEQLPPKVSWGQEYIGARLSPQVGCDSFFGVGVGLWRVVAGEDGTSVQLLPAPGVSIDGKNLPAELTFQLDRGASQSFFARSARGSAAQGDFFVQASGPIMLAQWLDCEPGLSWGIDARLGAGSLAVTFPPGFDHEVVVVRKRGNPVMFDGYLLPEGRFRSVFETGGYEAARLQASDLKRCVDALDRCEHRFSGAALGIGWRGMDVVCSYSLTVPSWNVCALPNVTCPP